MRTSSNRLFHAVVVVGAAIAVPALSIGSIAALSAIGIAGCGDDSTYAVVDIGVPGDMSYVVDIGIPGDMSKGSHD